MRLTSFALAVAVPLSLSACVPGGSSAFEEAPQPPTSELSTVVLAQHPENEKLAAFYCPDLLNSFICSALFDAPPLKESLIFSFEMVFKLGNPNKFSVPMVEFLLALKVFPDDERVANLGAICVSFCDPAAEDCVAKPAAEACKAPDKTVNSLEDFVPTLDDLVRIAKKAAAGELDDNLKFRVIPARGFQRCRPTGTACQPCEPQEDGPADQSETVDGNDPVAATESICCDGADPIVLAAGCHVGENEEGLSCELCDGEVEAHIRFDLGVDAITSLLKEVASDSEDALSNGDIPSFDIPYSVEGSLFFDVPVLGRFAAGFGPFADTWSLD